MDRKELLKIISRAEEKGLKELNLSNKEITKLPPEIGNLSNLRELDLSSNQLTSLPPGIGNLSRLTDLHLDNNQLKSLPHEIGNLSNLRTLYLYNNRLTSLPKEIGNLSNLTVLYLSGNRLTSLPLELGNLSNLTDLHLDNNQLMSLPPEIGNLSNLYELDLESNQLTSLPPEIGKLPKLSIISLLFNPIPVRLLNALRRSKDDLKSYLTSLEKKEETEELFEAKLLLVGEGAVGKTCLLSAMKGEPFKENRSTTHGVEICKFELDHPYKKLKICFNAWDFGGQIVYQVTNQFFYSHQALYLLLWDPRQDTVKCDVEGWIKRIRLRIGQEARIIIVATHSRTGNRVAHIDQNFLKELYGDIIADFYEVDSGVLADGKTPAEPVNDVREKFGINGLKRLIAEVASKLPQMGFPFNIRWKVASDEALALRSAPENRAYIPYSRFVEICHKQRLDEKAIWTLIGMMHNLGHILYYGEYEALKEWVILQPEWITKAIGFVLEDKETNCRSGELEHHRLRKIWFDHNISDRERYRPDLHPFFLRLMEHFDVSYRLEEGNASLVAQLVPDVRPSELPWLMDSPKDPAKGQLTLVCSMDESPVGLVPWMIVRTHYYATPERWQWKYGMFLRYNSHGEGLLELRGRELFITVRAEWPNYFIAILQDTMERLIKERWEGLQWEFAVPCKGVMQNKRQCSGRFVLKSLYDIQAKGGNTIWCQTCITEQNIHNLLIGYEICYTYSEERLKQVVKESIQEGVSGFESRIQNEIRRILKAIDSEGSTGPRLFSLVPKNVSKFNPKQLGFETYWLNLWCEMPDKQHPISPLIGKGGSYWGEWTIDKPREWLVGVAPYISVFGKIIKNLIPIAQVTGGIAFPQDMLDRIDLVTTAIGSLTEGDFKVPQLSVEGSDIWKEKAEGAALRELHSLLNELDPSRHWGGLRKVRTKTGDYLWLCPEHYKIYDPGIPKLT